MAVNKSKGKIEYKYSTTKKIVLKNCEMKNSFVISVAKGMKTTLERSFTASVTTKMSGDTPYISLECNARVEAKYSTKQEFSGPPENSRYNSREYRVRFLGNKYSWKQTKFKVSNNGKKVQKVATRSGNYIKPSNYALYSVDRRMQ